MTLLSVRGGDGGDEATPVRTAKEAAARLREAEGTLTLELLPARSGASWRGLLRSREGCMRTVELICVESS